MAAPAQPDMVMLSEEAARQLDWLIAQFEQYVQKHRRHPIYDGAMQQGGSVVYVFKGAVDAAAYDDEVWTPGSSSGPLYRVGTDGELVSIGGTQTVYNVHQQSLADTYHIVSKDTFGRFLVHWHETCVAECGLGVPYPSAGSGTGSGSGGGSLCREGWTARPLIPLSAENCYCYDDYIADPTPNDEEITVEGSYGDGTCNECAGFDSVTVVKDEVATGNPTWSVTVTTCNGGSSDIEGTLTYSENGFEGAPSPDYNLHFQLLSEGINQFRIIWMGTLADGAATLYLTNVTGGEECDWPDTLTLAYSGPLTGGGGYESDIECPFICVPDRRVGDPACVPLPITYVDCQAACGDLMPQCWYFEVAGMLNGDCGFCTNYNGEWTLAPEPVSGGYNDPGPYTDCTFRSAGFTGCGISNQPCPGASCVGDRYWRMTYWEPSFGDPNWILLPLNIAAEGGTPNIPGGSLFYELTNGVPCDGDELTFSLHDFDEVNENCTLPHTLTLTPVACEQT